MAESPSGALAGRRLLVVGASVSVGASVAIEAAARGAQVAVAARRKELLDGLIKPGGPQLAVQCDATVAADCERVVAETVAAFGGLDWIVYTPALFFLANLDEIEQDTWRRIFDTNVIGAALVTKAAIPHLVASRGRALYFTSVSMSVVPHWAGLASYAVSKTALHRLIECWTYEQPEVGFTLVELGDTEGSDGPNAAGWTPEQINRFIGKWVASGRMSPTMQDRSTVANSVLHALTSPSYIERLMIAPPRSVPEGDRSIDDTLAEITSELGKTPTV